MSGPSHQREKKRLAERIAGVLRPHKEIVVSYLYGSAAKGYEGKRSDVDVGLLLRRDFEAGALYQSRIAGEIKERCGFDQEIDVRILNEGSYRFLHQVIKEGVVILCRDEGEKIEFETSVTDRYIDFKPFYEQYDRTRRERMLKCP